MTYQRNTNAGLKAIAPAPASPARNLGISSAPTASTSASSGKISPVLLVAIGAVCIGLILLVAAPYLIRQEIASSPAAVEVPDVNAVKARAEKGEAEAQKTLGSLYSKGLGLEQDYKQAAHWYRLAADQGHAGAQIALGELYEVGQGVPRDEAQAAQLFRRAADQGNPVAQYSLAILYVTGRGVEANVTEAVKWYRRAANQGDSLAQFNLGVRYNEGNGVTADPVEAYQWLTLAKAQGVADAAMVLEGLKRKMSREQIAEGKRRAESFVAKPEAATK